MTDALDIHDLSIYTTDGQQLARCERLSAARGHVVGLVGPSGCGKTTLLRSIAGTLPNGGGDAGGVGGASGRLRVLGTNVLALPPDELRTFRRERIGFVGQDPASRLNPRMRVRHMLAETANGSRATARHVLTEVGLPDSDDLLRRRPAQLSGGQQRRVALARALVRRPDLMLLDEPTAGLDPMLRRKLGDLLRSRAERNGTTIVVACHDLSLVDGLADEIVDLGGETHRSQPGRAEYQSALPIKTTREILRVDTLHAWVGTRRKPPVLRGIDLSLRTRESLGVVGPSGAGKTTLARAIAGLHKAVRGGMWLAGEPLHPRSERREQRHRRGIQLIPQDPLGTLNPSRSVAATLARPLRLHEQTSATTLPTRVRELLDTVELPENLARRYPHELSGGQRQRVAIARALAAKPEILVCDEVTSSMDNAAADAILRLLSALRRECDLALMMITHEIPVIARHTDRVLVLDEGRVAETGATADVLRAPNHPATAALTGEELASEPRVTS